MKKIIPSNTGFSLILCLSLLLFFASTATAQSGRRLPKLSPKPQETAPAKEPTPEETSSAKPQNKEPLHRVIVAYQLPSITSSHILTDAVLKGCLDQLQKSAVLKVQVGKEMNRKEASDLAKGSSDTFVVWLQLESDSFDPDYSNTRRSNVQSLYVNFVLYSPVTGKHKTQGHVYQRQRGVIPQGGLSGEYSLRRAGQDVADRVLSALNLPLPPERY